MKFYPLMNISLILGWKTDDGRPKKTQIRPQLGKLTFRISYPTTFRISIFSEKQNGNYLPVIAIVF